MKWYKSDSEIEQALKEVEEFMRKKGISIQSGGTLWVNFKDKEARLMDIEDTSDPSDSFAIPRMFESEKLMV